jgi:hypothetical protein
MAQRQGRNSALTRLQREIDLGNALKEPYTTPEKAVDIDIRTAAEKTRLLKWADNYTPIPWDDQVIAYWPEDQEQKDNNKKLVEDKGSREDIQETCVLNETSNTSLETYEPCQRLATPPTLPNTITNTPGISRAFGQFTLEPEPSLLPIPKTISSREAKKLAQNELCFDILDHDERLQALPREAIPVPPSITYGLSTELEQLVHDWEFGRTLVINECFIPLVHWRDIYKEYFPKWWAAIKQHWSRWRVGYLPISGDSSLLTSLSSLYFTRLWRVIVVGGNFGTSMAVNSHLQRSF